MLWEPFVGKGRSFQRFGRKRLHGTAASQRSGCFPLADSQRSGAPDDVRSPADGRKQAEFTSAVSAAGVVQAQQSVQRVWSRRAAEVLGSRKRSAPACGCRPMFPRCGNIGELGRISQMFTAERLTDALGTFSWQRPVVSTLWEKPGCRKRPSLNAPGVSLQPFLNALGPRTTSEARPTAASRRNSLPPLCEMTAVQVPPTVQCV